MVAMTHSRSTSSLGLQFNAFLFASIDEGASEARVSVVSALARLDLDPWQEAADLTQLPKESAVQRLASLLTNVPGCDPAHSDSHTIAQRLIGLLPGPGDPTSGSDPSDGAGAPVPVDLTLIMTLFIFMSVIAMATSGLTGHPPAAAANAAPVSAPAPSPALPKALPTEAQP
jgi:hypothetical protein